MKYCEKHIIDLNKESWKPCCEQNDIDIVNPHDMSTVQFNNSTNSLVRVCYKEIVTIENATAIFMLTNCSGSFENAGGYVTLNGHEVPVNGQTVMDIFTPMPLKIEVHVNANSSLTIDELIIFGLPEKYELWRKMKTSADVLVVTQAYPSYKNLYMSAFAHARNKEYINAGIKVLATSLCDTWYSSFYEIEGVPVYKGQLEDLGKLILRKQFKVVIVHFVDEKIFPILKENISYEKLIFICHGPETLFEVLHNKVRPYNSEPLPDVIENPVRRKYIEEYSDHENVEWVFVSDWLKNESEKVLGIKFRHSQVIGNIINEKIFPYKEKDPEDRKKILVIRKFDNIRQHSMDQVAKAIVELSKRPFFKDLHFSFYGDGDYYDELTKIVKDFDNIEFHRTFLPQKEIAKVHAEHGILLIPSRHDAHAVSMSEGASSGLVVVGSNVTSNPYFMDNEHNHTMVDPEDPIALADVIERLYYNPKEFLQISKRLSDYVHTVSSKENTIDREIALVKNYKNYKSWAVLSMRIEQLKTLLKYR